MAAAAAAAVAAESIASASAKEAAGPVVTVEALDWFFPPGAAATAAAPGDRAVPGGGGGAGSCPRWEVVLAADVVWLAELVRPFVDTLAALLPPTRSGEGSGGEGSSNSSSSSSPGGGRFAVLSYQRRGLDADAELWRCLEAAGLDATGPLPFDPIARRGPRLNAAVEGGADAGTDMAGSHVELGIFLIKRP